MMKFVIDFLVASKCERRSLCLKNEYCCDTPRQILSLQPSFEAVQRMSKLANVWCAAWPDSAYPDLVCPACHREKATTLSPVVKPLQYQSDLATYKAENCIGGTQLTDLLWDT